MTISSAYLGREAYESNAGIERNRSIDGQKKKQIRALEGSPKMPIHWTCPGFTKCRKHFQYGSGLKAHMASCPEAQSLSLANKRRELETMVAIIDFVDMQQKGNITLARQNTAYYKKNYPLLKRT
ncbi:hypothetical protein CAPTEDRAFT_185285 [Capitella teleta]|uniref:Uncharacterized protein n=1 Tax=Capitella teleta TaxID=283909 RepID=R7T5L1_CAPTE|nr:hypothetical protein CAPTEDRAFT_185285 [Capitella teleta]|eukprot:ELT88341.1 hypothetical protein CAPTEDRAFT_185285 [Capitella teleta]